MYQCRKELILLTLFLYVIVETASLFSPDYAITTNTGGLAITADEDSQLLKFSIVEMNQRQISDSKERKRQQNRIAQRTYRQNQKQRIRALEGALAQSTTMMKPPSSSNNIRTFAPNDRNCDEQMWDLSINDSVQSSDASLDFSHMLDLHSPQAEETPEKGTFDPLVEFFTLPATPSTPGRPALHRAVCNKNESMVRLLLEKGADFGKRDHNGQTALHVAVEGGHEGMVKLLLEGHNSNVKDSLGRTALFCAVKVGNDAVTRLLLDSSVDVNCKDSMGETALHVAVEQGSESSTVLLLKHGADIDA